MKTKAETKKPETRKKTKAAPKLRGAGLKKTSKEKKPKASLKTHSAASLAKTAPVPDPAPSRKAGKETLRAKTKASLSAAPDKAKAKTAGMSKNDATAAKLKKPSGDLRARKVKPPLAEAAPVETVEERKDEAPAEKDAKPQKSQKTEKNNKSESSDKALVKFDPLQRYLSEISKYRLLTRDEEREYGLRVKEQGDKDAAYALVTANLRLVVKIALEFQRVWMQNLLDLIQEGNIGLMQAVKKFDPYKNVKFSYYASFWIKAYILKFIMDNWRLVKIGTTQGQRKLFFKLKKEKQRLIDQGFDPKPKLLSERLGVSEREIVDMDQRLDSWDVSLDAPLKNDSETERIEFLSTDNESVEEQVSKKEIELLLHNKITEFRKKMTPREIEIFELRIFSDNPVTLQEIGDRYGISRERVRQVEKNIIRKMREFFKREIPDFASYAEDTGME
jgi:RNA polymerase sigma-32 factor